MGQLNYDDMQAANAGFALLWTFLFSCYLVLKRTSWSEKKTIFNGLFTSALISVLAVAILIFVVMIF